ncbi:MAG: hypothetical protein WC164_04085 [Patescibacteria group bacterium]
MDIWSEKWNYKPEFIGGVSKQTKDDFSLPKIAQIFDIEPLSWNDFEKNIIKKILESSYCVLEINQIKPIKVYEEQIIILSKDDYDSKIALGPDEAGRCSNGYLYICRNEDQVVFIHNLAHELSHLLSFYSLEIKERGKRRFINMKQSGYSIYGSRGASFYSGLNEAVTDLCAKLFLDYFLDGNENLFTRMERKNIVNYFSYPYHVALIETLIFPEEDDLLAYAFFESYFTGANCFFEILERRKPGLLDILKNMNASEESALESALVIGGESLVEKIKESFEK